ncbi:MAG: hypothetical protein V4550_19115 [Gemmatimonadota bacterium]
MNPLTSDSRLATVRSIAKALDSAIDTRTAVRLVEAHRDTLLAGWSHYHDD